MLTTLRLSRGSGTARAGRALLRRALLLATRSCEARPGSPVPGWTHPSWTLSVARVRPSPRAELLALVCTEPSRWRDNQANKPSSAESAHRRATARAVFLGKGSA